MTTEAVSTTGNEEDLSKYQTEDGVVLRWLKELQLVEQSQAQRAFEAIGEKAEKIYRNASGVDGYANNGVPGACHVFNVLYSTVEVLKPTYYWRMPKIVVERMHKDAAPVARLACSMVERCTGFSMRSQQDRWNFGVKSAVQDLLLPGRGQVWLRLDAEFEEPVDENGKQLLDDAGQPYPQMVKPNSERVILDYVPWKDYRESLSRNSFETRWRARRGYETRASGLKKYGEIFNEVELIEGEQKHGEEPKKETDFFAQAEVWEIEDSESKCIYYIAPGLKTKPLRVVKDRFRLSGFFSSPNPLLGTTTSESTHPTAFFKLWEALADELDRTLKRLSSIVECVRMVGATARQFNKDIVSMLKLDDGELHVVENWAQFAEKGGLKGMIDWLPFEQAVAAIGPLREQAEYLLAKIYEITGIPDVIRGSTDPREALGTVKSKLRWVTIKTEDKQADVQRFNREIVSKQAEIIFEPGLFSDETIALMDGYAQRPLEEQEIWPEALALLRNDRLRTFEVGIETDSTIAVDEAEDRESAMAYLAAMNQLLANVESLKQFGPEFLSPSIESVMAVARRFRWGRPLEGAWERVLRDHEASVKEAAANPAPPPPDYTGQELALKAQELELQGIELNNNFEIDSQKIGVEYAKIDANAQADMVDAQLKQFAQQFKEITETQRLNLEKFIAVQSEREKLIEEKRLSQEERIEALRVVHESAGKSVNTPAPVNVNTGTVVMPSEKKSRRRRVDIVRTPTGLSGVTEDLDDDPPANQPVVGA